MLDNKRFLKNEIGVLILEIEKDFCSWELKELGKEIIENEISCKEMFVRLESLLENDEDNEIEKIVELKRLCKELRLELEKEEE